MPQSGQSGAQAIAELLDLVALSGYQADRHGLGPVQWRALRYFASAAPSSRTVTAFAEHHGSSKASASKTVASMLRKGLLRRLANPNDSRSFFVELTEAGDRSLEDDPLGALVAAIERLSDADRDAIAGALRTIVTEFFRHQASSN